MDGGVVGRQFAPVTMVVSKERSQSPPASGGGVAVAFMEVVASRMMGPGSIVMLGAAKGMTLMPVVAAVPAKFVIMGPVVGHPVPMLGAAVGAVLQGGTERIRRGPTLEVATNSQQR